MKVGTTRSTLGLGLGAMALALCAHGCAPDASEGEGEPGASAAQDIEVAQQLQRLGLSAEDAVIDGELVKAEDLFFDRQKLLQGEYDLAFHAGAAGDKAHGNSTSSPVTSWNAVNIKLAWATGLDTPGSTVRNAFINAAGDYNATCSAPAPNNCAVYISQNNNGPWIVIHEIASASWSSAPCLPSEVACTTPPSGGAPGGHIYVKSAWLTGSCPSWTSAAIAHVARHELGHALGFNHPGDGVVLPTTTSQVGAPAPNYGTVMNTVGINASCNFSPTLLQTDDKAGLRWYY